MNDWQLHWKFVSLFLLLMVCLVVLLLSFNFFFPNRPDLPERAEKRSAAGRMEKKTEEAVEEKLQDNTTEVINLTKAGLFKENKASVRGRTVRGQSISSVSPFRVLRRKGALENFPCSDCHEDEAANPRERELTEEHEDISLDHGQGRFWCLTCHGTATKDTLSSLKGKPIDFNFAFVLCGQCHFQRQKDWYFGGHGKRVGAWPKPREAPLTHDRLKVKNRALIGTWKGPRVILSCPACHDPHSPSIKPYLASPPPKVRQGLLPRVKRAKVHLPPWERYRKSPKGH